MGKPEGLWTQTRRAQADYAEGERLCDNARVAGAVSLGAASLVLLLTTVALLVNRATDDEFGSVSTSSAEEDR